MLNFYNPADTNKYPGFIDFFVFKNILASYLTAIISTLTILNFSNKSSLI